MRGGEVNAWAQRDDPERIDGRMAAVIMPLDVLHVDRAAHARDLVDLLGVIEDIWVLSQQLLVAFEVDGINLFKHSSRSTSNAPVYLSCFLLIS